MSHMCDPRRLEDFGSAKTTPEIREAARRYIARHAVTAADSYLLMDALGLNDGVTE